MVFCSKILGAALLALALTEPGWSWVRNTKVFQLKGPRLSEGGANKPPIHLYMRHSGTVTDILIGHCSGPNYTFPSLSRTVLPSSVF